MSQSDAQRYRSHVRADLADEITAHDPTMCPYCTDGQPCPELEYARRADELVERRLRRRAGGPSQEPGPCSPVQRNVGRNRR
ncbi:hypothetical protein GCM10009682_19240 [Luedemannella flava]|uniref:Uncharacterized protein n=1 Tax=Luedemannella flava TaxID=349316 RepID=A0ABP4XXM3_9ACTN